MTPEDHFVGRLLSYFAARWQHILVGAVIGLIAGIAYLHFATKYYTATIVVGPTSAVPAQAGLGNLSGLSLSGFGGIGAKISSFVGGNSGSAVSPFDAFQQTLTSHNLARRLMAKPELIHRLFYANWDRSQHRWQEPTGIGATVKRLAKAILGIPQWHPPDEDTIEQYLKIKLGKTPQPGSSLVALTFEFENPSVARDFLGTVYQESDKIVRNMDLVRSTKIIDSINAELNGSAALSTKATDYLIQFLDQEYQVRALARANAGYSADIFDLLSVSERPTRPLPLPVILIGMTLGACFGTIYASLLKQIKRRLIKPTSPLVASGAVTKS